jgi:ADP-heptose:LPS heptosyltransferase
MAIAWVVSARSRAPDAPAGDPRTILVIQLDHLGDAVISTVLFPSLRTRYPDASIEVLAGPWNREVFEAIAEVDRVHVCRVNRFARGGWLGWIASTLWWGFRLRRRHVDLGIDVRGEFPHAAILWLSGARRRLGWDCGGGGFLLTRMPHFVRDRPELESRLALLAELGIGLDQSDGLPRPTFDAPDEARRRVARWLAVPEPTQQSGDGWLGSSEASPQHTRPARSPIPTALFEPSPERPRIVLHVGAGMPAKRWPAEHWRALLARLCGRLGAEVVLVGGTDDRTIARAILGPRPRRQAVDGTGRLRVAELAALLEQADLFVGADSGPAHLAAAVGTPGVVLFSGTNSPRQWQPAGEHMRVLRHAVACSPCHRRRCPLRGHPCMRGLTPAEVAQAVERIWAETGGVAAQESQSMSSIPKLIPSHKG